jgi:dipeptidyl aminopeptidase/acylaminoacyl peptidase
MTGTGSGHEGPGPKVAPYGSWASPLSAQALGGARVNLGDLRSLDGRLYWTQTVPAAGGISTLLSLSGDGHTKPVTPDGVNVRTRVHEYGGAPFVVAGDTVYYSQFSDQRLYALKDGGNPVALTPVGYRYADCISVGGHSAGSLICVREDHTDPSNVRNALVRVPLPGGGAGDVLYGDSDFVAFPRVSPDGRQLAFIAWNHPHMPWDATELKVSTLGEQGLETPITVAGGAAESIVDPQWDTDGTLYFISDRSGYWNLNAWNGSGAHAVWARAADFAKPQWTVGQSHYALTGDGFALVCFGERGLQRLAVVDLRHGIGRVLDLPYVEYSDFAKLDAAHVAAIAGSAYAPSSILTIDVKAGTAKILYEAAAACCRGRAFPWLCRSTFRAQGDGRRTPSIILPRTPTFGHRLELCPRC